MLAGRIVRLGRLLWPHARGHRGLLVRGLLLSTALIALRLAQPWPLKWVVDSLSGIDPPVEWLAWAGGQIVLLLAGLYLFVALLAGIAEYGQQLLLAGLGNRITYDFRARLFTHLLNLPLAFHERRSVGEFVTRIVSDTSRLRRGVNGIMTRIVQVVLMFLCSVVVIFILDWRLALIVGLGGSIALLVMSGTAGRIMRAARKKRRREGRISEIVAENLRGIRDLQAFNAQRLRNAHFERKNARSLSEEQKVRRLEAGLVARTDFILTLCICCILWFGSGGVAQGNLSLGTLVLFIHYAVGLYGPFRMFAKQSAVTGRTLACADRLMKMLATEPAVRDLPDAAPLPASAGHDIVYDRVSLHGRGSERERRWILRDVSLSARAGERVAVMGPNGAGKSTLLRLALRFADPDAGSVAVSGRDLRTVRLSSLRDSVSAVFQSPVLFGVSVAENILLGRPGAGRPELERAARAAGLERWVASLPDGYDSVVRRHGEIFSEGERQKLALARALVRDGSIWLLDEPEAGLDAAAKADILPLLLDATADRTTLWVTHDAELAHYCHRVIWLEEGAVVFSGTPREFESWSASRRPVVPAVLPVWPNTPSPSAPSKRG